MSSGLVTLNYNAVFHFWFIVTEILYLHRPHYTIAWQNYTDDNIFYLYFTNVNDYSSSNADADNKCILSGYRLLEIENEKVQKVLDNAMTSWANNMAPLPGFKFRLNLDMLISDWTWLNGTKLAAQYVMNSYPYFAYLNKNASGISYRNEFERELHNFICSYKAPCGTGSNQMFNSNSQSCIAVFTTNKLNWFSARYECIQLGGDLAVVSPQDSWTSNLSIGTYWIGLAKAKYVWSSTGKLVSYTHWYNGEPMQGYDCTSFKQIDSTSSAFWYKYTCSELHPVVCMSGSIPVSSTTSFSATSLSYTSSITSTTTSQTTSTTTSQTTSTTGSQTTSTTTSTTTTTTYIFDMAIRKQTSSKNLIAFQLSIILIIQSLFTETLKI